MSAAFYPVIERHDKTDPPVDGKALSRDSDLLERVAVAAGVVPLLEFTSIESDDYGLLEEAGVDMPPAQWFSAADGLKTVRALRLGVEQTRTGDEALSADLQALENVLMWADERGLRWHLAVDI